MENKNVFIRDSPFYNTYEFFFLILAANILVKSRLSNSLSYVHQVS